MYWFWALQFLIFLNGLYHRRVFIQVSLQKWPWILWMGFVGKISWPEMKSTEADDNRRVKQATCMLRYSSVSLFLKINITQIEASVTIFSLDILISQFLENDMFSIEMAPRM